MQGQETGVIECLSCHEVKPNFFQRYRDFLLSRDTILTFFNALFLLVGFIVSVTGFPSVGHWLYLASVIVGGTPLFIFAAKGLIIRHDITAGVMVSVAMIAAIIVGEYIAAALVVFMMSVGEWMENFTIARANDALRELAKLVPATVTVRRNDREIIIPLEQVVLKDVVLVRTGERIGVDGDVIAGDGSVNQAAITGESIPIEKQVGDQVFAGTLNEVGRLEIRVTRLGEDTTLGQIVKLVKDAQATQAPVQRIANKYAKVLVPITFGIAILVYLLTQDILRSITVLVVVCPCALVLATPTAVVAAIGNAAKSGILVKAGAVMEQVGKVDVVAFDKTGTLTHGKPVVKQIVSLNGFSADRILSMAGTTERFSEHPIGRSIVEACREKRLDISEPIDFSVLPGYGVTAKFENHEVIIGSRAMLLERSINWPEAVEQKARHLEESGQTVIPVAIDGHVEGLIALADTPRGEARDALRKLKQLGIKELVMITGDNTSAANHIAKELGIDRVYAEVLPQDKLNIIRQYQSQGKKVLFAGDGVNDAPALAAADIGLAMGVAGTDVAIETADVSLMTDEISRLPQIIELSRRALIVIKQNVIFSMSMNVLSVILGSFGIIGPVFGALMHEASALPVLANSARLIDFSKNKQVNGN